MDLGAGGGVRAQHFAAAGKACGAHRCEYTLCLLCTCVCDSCSGEQGGQIKFTNRIFYLNPERTVKKNNGFSTLAPFPQLK